MGGRSTDDIVELFVPDRSNHVNVMELDSDAAAAPSLDEFREQAPLVFIFRRNGIFAPKNRET